MNGIISALLLTLIAGAATGIGGALVLFKKKVSSSIPMMLEGSFTPARETMNSPKAKHPNKTAH